MLLRSARFARLALVLFCASVIFSVVMALLPRPPEVLPVEMGDKWHHILAFVTMTTMGVLAFPRAAWLRLGERLSFLGAMIEVVQSIPALHRDCDPIDWVADSLAIAAVLVVATLLARRRAG